MRRRMIAAAAAAVFACLASGAMAQPSGDSEAEYLARCRSETLAQNPQAGNWVDSMCAQNWGNVAAAGPMAQAILDAAPTSAAPVDYQALRGRLTGVRWNANGAGRLGALDVAINRTPAPPNVSFAWSAVGELVPYDVIEALRIRGAQLSLVGCLSYGAGEVTNAFAVTPAGGRAFGLTVYAREAPTANASSFFSAVLDVTGQTPTLQRLRAGGDEWSATCSN